MCAALYFVMSFPLARWARRIERHLAPIQATEASVEGQL
jgi:hypothetical protein